MLFSVKESSNYYMKGKYSLALFISRKIVQRNDDFTFQQLREMIII